MMRLGRLLGRLLGRVLLAILVLILGLLVPVAYVETLCRGPVSASDYTPLLPEEHHRLESRTLLTYPEWHIVHAYDDYAEVITQGDPQDFDYLSSIGGFWSSLCALSQSAGAHGGADWPTKQMIYTIGVSFTVELALKAAYEETLGRVAAWIRGPQRSALDDLSARQASDYATFLQQVPWYHWDFRADTAALHAAATGSFRDRERLFALGLEATVKAGYAGVIAKAVAGMEPDALTMRVVVQGLTADDLAQFPDVTIIGPLGTGTEVETPRYRAFTDLAKEMSAKGADFVEIAGNDDILFTAITDSPDRPGALHSFVRQGNPGYRHLVMLRVADLAGALRQDGQNVEHIHDH